MESAHTWVEHGCSSAEAPVVVPGDHRESAHSSMSTVHSTLSPTLARQHVTHKRPLTVGVATGVVWRTDGLRVLGSGRAEARAEGPRFMLCRLLPRFEDFVERILPLLRMERARASSAWSRAGESATLLALAKGFARFGLLHTTHHNHRFGVSRSDPAAAPCSRPHTLVQPSSDAG